MEDDRRILSMVKTLSQHPAKRRTLSRRQVCHCESHQSREDFTRANTECSPQGANKARLDFAKKHLKKPDHFWKSILWMAEIKINLYQNDGKKKVWRRLGTARSKAYNNICETWSSVMAWAAWLPVALGYWCLVMWCDRRQKQRDEFWSV